MNQKWNRQIPILKYRDHAQVILRRDAANHYNLKYTWLFLALLQDEIMQLK
jgi:hypothetical protein